MINQGQVDKRAGHNANMVTFMEEMKNEISYCSQIPLVTEKGIAQNITVVHATILAEAKFKPKTALGVSNDFYQHCEAFPIY
eukprot:6631496-Ditylum_brightwellii.AAC.1